MRRAWLVVAVAAIGLAGRLACSLLEIGPRQVPAAATLGTAAIAISPTQAAEVPDPPRPNADRISLFAIYGKDCRAHFGRGPAAGTAGIMLPAERRAGEAESVVAVVDQAGAHFKETVPFRAHRIRVGRQPDGTVVAAFGDTRRNAGVFRPPDSPEPLHVYVDGQLFFRSDKAWDFDVAADGSSFFVHEPLAGGASQLVVHDLTARTVRHVDLGLDYTPANEYEPDFGVAYAVDQSSRREIVFYPAYADAFGRGRHLFYSVETGEVREILVGPTGDADSPATTAGGDPIERLYLPRQYAVLASSTAGYLIEPLGGRDDDGWQRWRVAGQQFEFGAQPNASPRWTREIALRRFGGHMILGGDGRWLAIRAWNFQVLDTRTGATLFEFPQAGDKRAERERLASVLPADATYHDVGAVTGERFEGEALVLARRIGSNVPCRGRDHEAFEDCLDDLRRRGVYRTVLDVYDMNTVQPDSQPDYRLEYDRRVPCQRPALGVGRLAVEDGELTFAPDPRAGTSAPG